MLNYVVETVKEQAKAALQMYPRHIRKQEYEGQSFLRFNERPVEFGFLFRQVARYYPKTLLDVGTGDTAIPHVLRHCGSLVTAIDNISDYWPEGMVNRHYHVIDQDITAPTLSQKLELSRKFEMISCISVLEHIEDHDSAVRNMIDLLVPGGHLVLTCPYTEKAYVRNCYKLESSAYGQDAPYICQSFSREQLDRWCADNGCEVVEQEFWQFWTGRYWTQGGQIIPPTASSAEHLHQHSCILIRKSVR